jgi:DNA-binding MarR family transcriptional regulator
MATHDEQQYAAEAGIRLAVAVKRFRSRMRVEAGTTSSGWTILQLTVLRRVIDNGPTTAAALAVVEHVSQQAIAQSVAPLKDAGLVHVVPDANDGRKRLIDVTAAGRRLVEAISTSRDTWLAQAIAATVPHHERPVVEQAIELLERLAAVDLGHQAGVR